MDIKHIDDSEMLYRMVKKSYPDAFCNGVPTAALFMDPGGASVDRDGGRIESDIIASFKNRFKKNNEFSSAVKISAKECRDADTFPNPVNNKKNKFHAEIWDSKDTIPISLVKAVRLAGLCKVVK